MQGKFPAWDFCLAFFWFFSGCSEPGNGAGMLAAGRSRQEGGRSHTVCMARPSDAADADWQQNGTVPGSWLRCTQSKKRTKDPCISSAALPRSVLSELVMEFVVVV